MSVPTSFWGKFISKPLQLDDLLLMEDPDHFATGADFDLVKAVLLPMHQDFQELDDLKDDNPGREPKHDTAKLSSASDSRLKKQQLLDFNFHFQTASPFWWCATLH